MDNLNFLLDYCNNLKVEIHDTPFHEDDIRKMYFTYYYDLVYNLYINKSMYQLSTYVSQGGLMYPQRMLEFENHIKRLIEVPMHATLTRSFNNSVNRSFFFYSFSSFEVCLNVFCENIFNEEEIAHLFKHSLNEIHHILKGIELGETIQKKLNKLLIKNHITHVPFIRKIDLLFKYCKNGYDGSLEDDREFLIFLSKLRNTVHTQWVYFGNDYKYNYGQDINFIFENSKQVVWTNPFEDEGARLFVDIFDRLKAIWRKFIFGIPHDEFIAFYDENV